MMARRHNACIAGVCFVFLFATCGLTSRAAGQNARAGVGTGKDVFERRCSGCHAADSHKEGPRLRGVLGRTAGTSPGFQYSEALRNSGLVWDEPALSKWLENPQALVRDNDMEFRVPNPSERAAVVAYLKSLTN